MSDIAMTTVTSTLIVTCIIGNSLVCAIIKRNREMRIPINYLLVNLAVGDITYATFHITELVYRHTATHPDGFTGKVVCLLRNGTLQWIGTSSSIFTLVAIAFERYFAVLYPYSNRGKLTMRRLKVIIIGCWILSLIVNIRQFLRVTYVKDTNKCVSSLLIFKGIITLWSVLIIISSTLMIGLHSRVVYTLWFKHQGENMLTPQQQGVLKVRKRVTLMVFTITAIFAICYNTDFILHTIERSGSFKLGPYAIPIGHTMLMFNAAVNPFAYALISERFRKKIKEMLCCSFCSSAERALPSRDIEMPNNTSQSIDQQSKPHRVTHIGRITAAPPDLANSSPVLLSFHFIRN